MLKCKDQTEQSFLFHVVPLKTNIVLEKIHYIKNKTKQNKQTNNNKKEEEKKVC